MIIGIDFDNTIACYDKIFSLIAKSYKFVDASWTGKKQEVKDILLSQQNGEKLWQTFQGKAYGSHMYLAELFPGVANFLLHAKFLGHRIIIISHKTEFGHFDKEKVSLRAVALEWMNGKNFFDNSHFGISINDVHFLNSRREKIEKIQDLCCDVFIDDLVEVFEEMPDRAIPRRILFGGNQGLKSLVNYSAKYWSDIDEYILGKKSSKAIINEVEYLLKHRIESCERVYGGGNSQIYKIYDGKRYYALKKYPIVRDNVASRLEAETIGFGYLRNRGIENIPSVVSVNKDLNMAIFSWVDGLLPADINSSDINECISFIARLKDVSQKTDDSALPLAAEACISHQKLIDQIVRRINQLKESSNQDEILKPFFDNELIPLWESLQKWQDTHFPHENFEQKLDDEIQILSPSDFGFHNAIKMTDGSYTWIDFEYFGWDDPIKLVADFLWHPAMKLSNAQGGQWIRGCANIFVEDKGFYRRLRLGWPLYGIRWILILLNQFLIDYRKFESVTQEFDPEQRRKTLKEQLIKANLILNELKESQFEIFNRY
jgi:hypothetical protein